MKSLFQPYLEVTGKAMDMQLQRQNVITSNIANVKTPGYLPLELEFEEELQRALNIGNGKVTRTNENHMPARFDANNFAPGIDHAFKPRRVFGEDRVNIDKEMANMAKVNLNYSTLATVTTKGYEGIKDVIQEGSK